MSNIIERILNEVCLDDRVVDGAISFDNPTHVDVLREYMISKGIPESVANEECNRILEKGQHPERQAYNKDGLLVTFPTSKHKADAITAGTHFDKDPTKPPSNIFGGEAQQDQPSTPQDAQNQPSSQPAPTPEPPLKTNNVPETPQEKMATAKVIMQVLSSDNSVLEETAKWLEGNAPDYLQKAFHK